MGHGTYYGAELSASGQITDNLAVGGNYTYQLRHIHTPADVAPLELTGDPGHKGFVYLNWLATPDLTVTPNISLASNRWTSNTAGTVYFKTGAFALLGLSADYSFADHFDLNVGVKNLLDENYQLSAGFPEPGRTFFAEVGFANSSFFMQSSTDR